MKSTPDSLGPCDAAGVEYLTPADLVARWAGAVTTGTLANWRSAGNGPPFLKLGHRTVRYRLADIQQFERARVIARADSLRK